MMQIANLPLHQRTSPAATRSPPVVVAASGVSMKKPSFLIKDILSSSNRQIEVTDSIELHPPMPPPSTSPPPMAINEYTLNLPPQFHLYPTFETCIRTPFCLPRPGFSLNMEALLDPSERSSTSSTSSFSLPIPLPVYVRTRSPPGEAMSKPKKCRRSRTVFTELQLMGLESKFESQKYLSTPDRIQLAETLGLTQIQVKTWYQNRRMKWKKQVLQKGGTEPPTKPKGRPKKNCFLYPEKLDDEGQRRRSVIEEIDLSETHHLIES